MILQALVKEYENLAQKGLVSKPGWSQAKVSYAIDLKDDGSIKVILFVEDRRTERKKDGLDAKSVICTGNGDPFFRCCCKFPLR